MFRSGWTHLFFASLFGLSMGWYDFTGYVSTVYVHHKLTVNNMAALVIQSALMQSRWDAQFASQRAKLVEPSSGVCHPIKSFER